MATVQTLINACQAIEADVVTRTQQRLALWENWLQPLSADNPTGDEPGYDDDFQQMREEVSKFSGPDADLVCRLGEKLLLTTTKDIRVASYYAWARLHRDGEAGLADGLELMAALMLRFDTQLHPQRERSRQGALEWLASSRMLNSLSRYPEVNNSDNERIAGALMLLEQGAETPLPAALYTALEARLQKSGGPQAVVPQNVSDTCHTAATEASVPLLSGIVSGQELLAQARVLADYLKNQPDGWLAAHRLIKNLRHDTLRQLPPLLADGRTRIEPPKPDQRALLKRLYLQQSWRELIEEADSLLSRGANHLWLDVQWYLHQALVKSGYENEAAIIQSDLKGLLSRLAGLETLAFNDGTPFADEVTLNWIQQQVLDNPAGWTENHTFSSAVVPGDDDILQLEPEALALADSEGAEVALAWLQNRPGITSTRNRWLLRLLMARVAEQTGKNELALHLLGELDGGATAVTLTQWEPGLLFEVKARRLKLLRMKAGRSEAERARLSPLMEQLLAGLVATDPVKAAVLCG
ncbi:type VI secretion system protein TssA [Enterobacter cloacae]|uniref:type VI secretion system protein TssA n=1 Tax=Enterobacter cloacae TaxID=550 RepID=UPI00111F1115|nr:type VI secretion system protein TssA [Enterobacter cloacae]MBD8457832.1 type VI secretion system protein TssA [Enterobacter cloacae]MCI1184386.1 type VI secretion system protein TssA [Enterobacter cloacae]MCK6747914.1 type VI secretion system protein TssA [Enterobacter cloacae]MCQ4387019.1 type VI secretion system protein TssA [Enterobacter cloacae]MCT9037608.1 type VI secretion system protein TssA [Enterobacter cloacae]